MILEFRTNRIPKLFLMFENENDWREFYSFLCNRFKELNKDLGDKIVEFTTSIFIDKMLPTLELNLSISPFIDNVDNFIIAKLNFTENCHEFIDIPAITDYFKYPIANSIMEFKWFRTYPLFTFKRLVTPEEYNFTFCGEVLDMFLIKDVSFYREGAV